MKVRSLFVFFLSISFCTAMGQDLSLYQKKWLVKGGDTLPYRILLPENFDAAKKYPLILFLHGAGERGRDNEAQLIHGSKLFLQDSIRNHFPAIVVFPQCAPNSFWSNVNIRLDSAKGKREFLFKKSGEPTVAMRLLESLLTELKKSYKLDKEQLYVGGLSMGGMGTFELVRRHPKVFAAAFPICGGAHPETAKALKRTSWWIFHGLKDDVVPPEWSSLMADALKKKGADVRLTLYPDANHNSWDPAFAEKDLLPWLFSKHR